MGSMDWNEERVNQQRQLAATGRAGCWVLLEGGPRHGTRGFLPHLEWPFFVIIDPKGLTWSFASPPEHIRLPTGAEIVGVYGFDRQHEVMTWQATEGTAVDVPSVRLSRS